MEIGVDLRSTAVHIQNFLTSKSPFLLTCRANAWLGMIWAVGPSICQFIHLSILALVKHMVGVFCQHFHWIWHICKFCMLQFPHFEDLVAFIPGLAPENCMKLSMFISQSTQPVWCKMWNEHGNVYPLPIPKHPDRQLWDSVVHPPGFLELTYACHILWSFSLTAVSQIYTMRWRYMDYWKLKPCQIQCLIFDSFGRSQHTILVDMCTVLILLNTVF